MSNYIYFLILGLMLVGGCKTTFSSKSKKIEIQRIGFYNVENLFDTEDDPNKKDEEFTPTSKKKWTIQRYQDKLNKIAQIIDSLQFPILMGLCEVENRKVLEDLVQLPQLNNIGSEQDKYFIIHQESPDLRGIDVALLYRKSAFTFKDSHSIQINIPEDVARRKDYKTRDILHVEGVLNNNESIHVFVNHWPSRWGGVQKSQPKRIFVAQQLRYFLDSLEKVMPNSRLVVMGDFNDETDNKSVSEVLRAIDTAYTGTLFNCFAQLDQAGAGTYNYRGNWNMLDQIIVSPNLLAEEAAIQYRSAGIYRKDWLLFEHSKYGATPSRTYGGPNYYGGYSDHLPIYIELQVKIAK